MLFLTLLVAQRKEPGSQLFWNVYYHLLLDGESAHVLQKHLAGLLAASTSLKDWRESEFGEKFRFGNTSTLFSVRHIWHAYAESLERQDQDQYRKDFETVLKHSKSSKDALATSDGALVIKATNSASPLGILSGQEVKLAMDSWWEKGTTGVVAANTNIPNPLFAVTLSKHSLLPRGADPILSYHLVTAYAHLTEDSVVHSKSGNKINKIPTSLAFVTDAQRQFSEWSQAFVNMASRDTTWRFIAADGLSFCHTLQHHLETGQLSGQLYRRQLTMERLELDPDEYGLQSKTPKKFDVIDTSDLEHSLGGLNILTSASPLLKGVPWATLYTESIIGGREGEMPRFKELLSGPTRTAATLLGLSPVEYWTNATTVSNVDEYILNVATGKVLKESERPGIHWRFAWKFHGHLSGQTLRLNANEETLVNLIYKVYRTMFLSEDMMALASLSNDRQDRILLPYPRYHRGSLVAFIRRLLQTVDAPQEAVCRSVLTEITQDSSLFMGARFSEAISLEMSRQGLLPFSGMSQDVQEGASCPFFSKRSRIPEAVAVTISIPAVHWKKFADAALEENIGFTVEGGLGDVQGDNSVRDHIFSDVQVTFGTVSTTGDRQSEDFAVAVDEDPASWSGNSDMVATFSVPTAALLEDPRHTKVSLHLHSGVVQLSYFNTKLQLREPEDDTEPIIIFETDLEDDGRVYVSKNQPGLAGSAFYSSLRSKVPQDMTEDCRSSFTADVDETGRITAITGRLDVMTPNGQKLLTDKASVEARKVSPFVFEIVVGEEEALYQLCFPVPVVKDGSVTRVARTSAYVEIMAHVADPARSQALDDFIFPSTLAKAGLIPSLRYTIPVPLNIPHVNLDNLPAHDVVGNSHPGFLTTLASWSFSARERKLRDQANSSGLVTSARMNFKESIFTMFMLASGLQGGQTGLFAISHPQQGGIHMLLFVSAIRLHGENATVVLDAAVIPFTMDIIKGGKLEDFLLVLRVLECCTITVNDEELVLWKKVLPALAERCRNWSHTPECEYARPGATIPLSTEMGEQVLCSCGAGKLPDDFLNLPEWDVAAKFATRIAISPTFAVPFVEDVIDPDLADSLSKTGFSVDEDNPMLRCMNCGSFEAKGGGPLKKCMRCLKMKYCSPECQKKDWKKHRMECGEPGGKSGEKGSATKTK